MAGRKYLTEFDRDHIRGLEDVDDVVANDCRDVTYATVVFCKGESKPFNSQTLSKFLHDAAGRGTPIEPRFLSNTEIHVISLPVPSISDRGFVAHYTRFDHSLELRAEFDVPDPLPDHFLPEDFFLWRGSFIVGLSTSFNPLPDSTSCAAKQMPGSINFPDTRATPTESRRKEVASVEDEAPASGLDPRLLERNLEVGQAVASVTFAAAAMGWDARLLGPSLGSTALGQLMCLTMETDLANELPVAAILIFPSPAYPIKGDFTTSTLKSSIMTTFTDRVVWNGRPYGVITPEQVDYVSRTILMAEKTGGDVESVYLGLLRYCKIGMDHQYYKGRVITLRQALKSRESVSVADLDGDYTMPRGNFWQFLLRCCYGEPNMDTRLERPYFPCGVLPWLPRVDVFVFVNRVDGLETGLYCLLRNRRRLKRYGSDDGGSTSFDTPYLWEKQRLSNKDEPFDFTEELYLLRRAAPEPRHKESSFLVAMVAPFNDVVMEADYMYMYSRQIWEAGFLGEVLAVEAQAQGLSVSALDSQDYNWKLALGISTADGCVISVYAVGKRKEGRKKLGLFKAALSGCFHGGAKHAVP